MGQQHTAGQFSYPNYAPQHGYMTAQIQQKYIQSAISKKTLPENAHRMAHIISLTAPNDVRQPIQFWQLYSVLGQQRIVDIVTRFYRRVYADEHWFRSVFANIGTIERHISTQSSMWIDVMGGGHAYHGGEFRLSFHHTHNAMQLMNDRGAQRWVKLMQETLAEPDIDWTDDPRVRPALNTFLTYFLGKYAEEFDFADCSAFGELNPAVKRKINFLNMTDDAIAALTELELRDGLAARGVDISQYQHKSELVSKALRL